MVSSQAANVGPAEPFSSPESTTPAPPPISRPRRQSSIRFSDDTSTLSRSPMSTRRRASQSDEATPIRQADGAPGRNYNTHAEIEEEEDLPLTGARSNQADSPNLNGEDKDEKLSLYKRIAEKYGSISLENKGSVARDHLALERTFLAWLRTSLAFASIGIAITQLFRLNTTIASRTQQHPQFFSLRDQTQLPYSPMIGQAVPAELVIYLQQLIGSAATSAIASAPTLGPTLLDQLLQLPPPGSVNPQFPVLPPSYQGSEFNEEAATRLRHVGKPLGATFLGISIIILFIGFHRYFESQYWIIRGKFPASRGSIFVVASIAAGLIVSSLVVVLVIAPTSFEKKK